jgi:murein DD-endopeptidase MepM/ murein hydrolase activator NlpD
MARLVRASLLLTALGVVSPGLPSAAAAANPGGAAPQSTPGAAVNGGAAPGVKPPAPPRASSARTGGAVPGQRPAVRVPVRRRPAAKPPAPKPTAGAPAPAIPTVPGIFPVAGPFSFDGPGARFGAPRNGHIHQGQDVLAASGTPLVAPLSGKVAWTANQPGGAGIYLVLHGSDGRDHVFMHIRKGTLAVAIGDSVRAGERIAEVGATGDAEGPHLHFEIWIGGWGTKAGQPIDPLPQLQRWAAGRR